MWAAITSSLLVTCAHQCEQPSSNTHLGGKLQVLHALHRLIRPLRGLHRLGDSTAAADSCSNAAAADSCSTAAAKAAAANRLFFLNKLEFFTASTKLFEPESRLRCDAIVLTPVAFLIC